MSGEEVKRDVVDETNASECIDVLYMTCGLRVTVWRCTLVEFRLVYLDDTAQVHFGRDLL